MPSVWCVRAEFGKYAHLFLNGNYIAIGWLDSKKLTKVKNIDELQELYIEEYPDAAKMSVAQNVGQISRFLFSIKEGDYVITPDQDTDNLFYGIVKSDYYYEKEDACPYPHRKKVKWKNEPLLRSDLSVPLQNTLRSSLTVFGISQEYEFLEKIGIRSKEVEKKADYTIPTLERILKLTAEEFEILIKELLAAIGFEAEHIGKSGDGGIDIEGTLNIYGISKVDLKVQAKRYSMNSAINAKVVRDFRGAVPDKSQACIITTCKFPRKARQEAVKDGYKRIGLIDGEQLVGLLTDNYMKLAPEIREKLNLKLALVAE